MRKQLDQLQSEMRDAGSDRLSQVLADLEKMRIQRDQLLQQVGDIAEQNSHRTGR